MGGSLNPQNKVLFYRCTNTAAHAAKADMGTTMLGGCGQMKTSSYGEHFMEGDVAWDIGTYS